MSGYKTYIIGLATIAFGITGYLLGMLDEAAAGGYILGGLAAMGLRHGIAKK